MNAKISPREFEAILTARILSKRMATPASHMKLREKIAYAEFLELTEKETIGLLRDLKLLKAVRIRQDRTGRRLFVISQITRKIACEIGVDFERAPNGKIKRPRVLFVSKFRLPATVEELILGGR